MDLIIGGNRINLPDLDPSLNKAILDLHAAFLGGHAYDLSGLSAAAKTYFDQTTDAQRHNDYFNSFSILWQNLFASGRYEDAEAIWKISLAPAIEWEAAHSGRFIHKGTPFYFWGMTAIIKGNLNKGYAFMHQALEEDLRGFPNTYTDLPSFAFASINYAKVDQAFRPWLLRQADFLNKALAQYRQTRGRALHLEQLQQRFLSAPTAVHAVFVFSHAISHFIAVDNIPEYARRSQFAGQMISNLLFDMLLVIDAAITPHNTAGSTSFLKHAAFLAQRAVLSITEADLRTLNAGMNATPDQTLADVLTGAFKFPNGHVPTGSAVDLSVCYALRNYGAHRLTPMQLVWDKYADIRQCCLNALFLAVEVLY
ncbi:MAG: hypothetical protein KJ956_14385 [Actinobacteria bacterium]|nr:hypothetical protein [Actinomycetota bacterium]